MIKRLLFAFVILALVLAPTMAAGAQETNLEVVASGLNNPRGLAFGPGGDLFVVEAGVGGESPCIPSPEGGEACYGASGSITRIDLDEGEQTRVAQGFPSLAENGFAAIGAHDITFVGAKALIVIGLGADPAARAQLGNVGMSFGRLALMAPNGHWRLTNDIAGYEGNANPDGGLPDSNPYSILVDRGKRIVADAGGNSLVMLKGGGSQAVTLAVFPDRMVEFPPESGGMMPMQAVPTTVTVGPDGAYYVGQLTGFPFPVGGANVYRVAPRQTPTVFAEGFTNIIDIAFGPDGRLYVLEIAANSLLSGDPMGALIRVEADGSHTIIADEGLVNPGGLVFGPDGSIYVSNYSVFPGAGEVVRITP